MAARDAASSPSSCASAPTTRGRSTPRSRNGAYDALRTALGDGARGDRQEQVTDVGPARPRRRRLRHRPEVVVPARRTCSRATSCVNGDEGEPSTFKDHMLVERDPHQLIEGIDHHGVRDPVPTTRSSTSAASSRSAPSGSGRRSPTRTRTGFIGKNILGSGFDLEIVLHRGAGCYIAGDETGLLSSLEGERAMPRIKPPFPAVAGPLRRSRRSSTTSRRCRPSRTSSSTGGEWYAAHGREPLDRHAHLLGVGPRRSGPATTRSSSACTFRELIDGLAGGVRGRQGARSSSSPAARRRRGCSDEHLDAPLDMDYVQQRARARCSGRARSWCSTRPPTRCSSRGGSRSSSRTSRAASARRAARARAGSRRCSTGCRTGYGRPEDLDLLLGVRQQHRRPASNAPFAHDHDLPARARARCRRRREPRPLLPRRDHRAHDARRRAPRRARRARRP